MSKTLELGCLGITWYVASVACTNGSKVLKRAVSSSQLGFAQLVLSALCAYVVCDKARLSISALSATPAEGRRLSRLLWTLAVVFALSFLALNTSFGYLDASLAVTLRAAEPLFAAGATVAMGKPLLPATLASLVAICAGAAVAASASAPLGGSISWTGVGLVALANVGFVARSVLAKHIGATFERVRPAVLFFHVCARGALVQGALLVVGAARAGGGVDGFRVTLLHPGGAGAAGRGVGSDASSLALPLVLNGIAFFLYLFCSFTLLARIPVITHTVANAMRRPFNVVAAVYLLDESLGRAKALGIALACAGATAYSVIQKSAVKQPLPLPQRYRVY